MIQFLKSHLRTLIWFTVGLTCVLLLALGLPVTQQSSTAASPHAYTPKNPPGTEYWSAGVTRDSDHLPDF